LINLTLLFLMAVALSGYVYQITFVHSKYRVTKFQGHHLIYRVLLSGILFFIVSAVLYKATWWITSKGSFLYDFAEFIFPSVTQESFNITIVSINAILIAFFWGKIKNFFIYTAYNILKNYNSKSSHGKGVIPRDKVKRAVPNKLKRSKTDRDYDLEVFQTFTDSHKLAHIADFYLNPRLKLFLLTLKSRKCYVCIPTVFKFSPDNPTAKELSFIPISTGYRHEEDLCLELTTDYIEVINILAEDLKPSEAFNEARKNAHEVLDSFKITVSYDEIYTIASFDLSKYLSFKKQENEKRVIIKKGRNEPIDKPREIDITPG